MARFVLIFCDIFCSSADIEWLHILRVFYSAINSPEKPPQRASLLTAEALLEQSFCQHSFSVLVNVVEAMERLSLHQLQVVSRGRYKERSNMDTHIEYDGVPALAASDASLILLCARCASSSTSSSGAGHFLGDRANVEQLVCARAFLVTVLCTACIDLIDNDQSQEGKIPSNALIDCLRQPPRASEALISRVSQIIQEILGVSTDTIPIHTSGSSSSAHTASWLPAARAATILSFSELLVRNYYAVVRVSMVGVMIILFVPRAVFANEVSDCLGGNLCQDLVSLLLVEVFATVPESRVSTVHMLLSNMLTYASKTSVVVVNSRTATRQPSTTHSSQMEYTFWAMTSALRDLCTLSSTTMSSLSHIIESYIPAMSLLPPSEMEKAVLPLIGLVSNCASFLGTMLTLLRKSLLHSDPEKVSFAIRTFVLIIPIVSEPVQMEIIQTVLHVLSMPVCYQTLLFHNVGRMCRAEIGAHRIAHSAIQRLLIALCERADSFFVSSSSINHDLTRQEPEGVFDATHTLETGARGPLTATNFKVRVNMQFLLLAIYHVESYICHNALGPSSCDAVRSLRAFVASSLNCESDHLNSGNEQGNRHITSSIPKVDRHLFSL